MKLIKRIPINLIAGTLGVGKTTAINHLLAQRPEGESWAVLVNEYGQVGLDAALLETEGVEIREVAGGCICCSAGFMFEVSLLLLLQRAPDRLIIEPTGLATLSGILDMLARPGISESVEVRSIITLVDPSRIDLGGLPVEIQDQIEAADILMANRTDLASPDELAIFNIWAQDLYPPKPMIGRVKHAQLPIELLDFITHEPRRVKVSFVTTSPLTRQHALTTSGTGDALDPPAGPTAERPLVRHEHASELATTIGWSLLADARFDAEKTHHWITSLSSQPGVQRIKAVVHTTQGWRSFNVAPGAFDSRPSGYRRDTRLEVIWMDAEPPKADALEVELLSLLEAPLPAPSVAPGARAN